MEDRYRVYVSKEEWEKLSELAQLELVALSMMTGEEIELTLPVNLRKKYIKLMENE